MVPQFKYKRTAITRTADMSAQQKKQITVGHSNVKIMY
jgi:hypothetical protein